MNVEEILMGRRTIVGCTEEVWKAKREEEKRQRAEEVANKIQ